MENSKIHITRKKARINGVNEFHILIDETPELTLSNGDTKSKNLNPGTYKIQVKMGRKGSAIKNIKIKAGETLRLNVSNTKEFYYANIAKFCIVFAFAIAIVFGNLNDKYIFYLLGAIGINVILEHTILINKYLTISRE